MFKPNVNNGLLTSRFDEIKTHLNHQLSFSPYSNQGHILVNNKHYTFEVDEDGHLYSPAKLDGYDYYKGKSYLGHYNDMTFSPYSFRVRARTEQFSPFFSPNIDRRTAAELSRDERLAEMRFILLHPLDAQVREETDEHFSRRHQDYDEKKEYKDDFDMIQEEVRKHINTKRPEKNDPRPAAELTRDERLSEMRYIWFMPDDAHVREETDEHFSRRHQDYEKNKEYKDDYLMTQQQVRYELEMGAKTRERYLHHLLMIEEGRADSEKEFVF